MWCYHVSSEYWNGSLFYNQATYNILLENNRNKSYIHMVLSIALEVLPNTYLFVLHLAFRSGALTGHF